MSTCSISRSLCIGIATAIIIGVGGCESGAPRTEVQKPVVVSAADRMVALLALARAKQAALRAKIERIHPVESETLGRLRSAMGKSLSAWSNSSEVALFALLLDEERAGSDIFLYAGRLHRLHLEAELARRRIEELQLLCDRGDAWLAEFRAISDPGREIPRDTAHEYRIELTLQDDELDSDPKASDIAGTLVGVMADEAERLAEEEARMVAEQAKKARAAAELAEREAQQQRELREQALQAHRSAIER